MEEEEFDDENECDAIHIAEIANEVVNKISEILKENDWVAVQFGNDWYPGQIVKVSQFSCHFTFLASFGLEIFYLILIHKKRQLM